MNLHGTPDYLSGKILEFIVFRCHNYQSIDISKSVKLKISELICTSDLKIVK